MLPRTQIICSLTLTFGVPVALALREYWALRASGRDDPPGGEMAPPPSPLPDLGGRPAPAAERPLPACLVPRRVRELA